MKVLITGAAGQDGKILASLLLNSKHHVALICRPSASLKISKLFPNARVVSCDLNDFVEFEQHLEEFQPDAIVNFAAFSSVKESWTNPQALARINVDLPIHVLNWLIHQNREIHFLQASSSEIFGSAIEEPQNENSRIQPLTPYGYSKALAHEATINFRENFQVKSSNLIFYNHESFDRSPTFVTRHISRNVAEIFCGINSEVQIGNVNARRDWGWASDYMLGVQAIIEGGFATDFVFATGTTHSVQDLLSIAFKAIEIQDYSRFLKIAQKELRMADPVNLRGDSSHALNQLGWEAKHKVQEFIPMMVKNDIDLIQGKAKSGLGGFS